jgi:ubiquinone/menaquinone biosynthesis C-methylase UbiE
MKTREAYDRWAKTYDSVPNKTRDLEEKAIRTVLENIQCKQILEIGCGTGKNTSWLANHCEKLTAVDFSPEMLKEAQGKVKNPKVNFQQADITQPWETPAADLITCSLVLEHIENLDFIFQQAASKLNDGGHFFICELHPYKQLQGSRAKFEEGGQTLHLEYFVHHISEYMSTALTYQFTCSSLLEWFDSENPGEMPRLVSYLFSKT